MEQITINIETPLTMALAISQGWKPTIDDTEAGLDGDEYPQIANTVTYQQFLAGFIPAYIKDTILRQGHQGVFDEIESLSNKVKDAVKRGDFDQLILTGDFEGIRNGIKSSI